MMRIVHFLGEFRALRVLAAAGLVVAQVIAAPPLGAQPPIQILDPIESGDRQVVLRWSKAPGDTFEAIERQTVTDIGFFAATSQGFARNRFRTAALIQGRGAAQPGDRGGVIEVGNAEDLFLASTPPVPPAPDLVFSVAGAFQFGRNLVGVAYTQAVDPASALSAGNYSMSPALAVTVLVLQDNGRTVILQTASNLSAGQSYELTVTGVTNPQGSPLASAGPFPFSAPVVTGAVNIAELYADPETYAGGTVTVFGQVTLPTGSRGGIANGFIQDGSGRGIRLLGGPVLSAVNSRNNAAVVTGTFDSPGVRIIEYTASSLATGLPSLGSRVLSLQAALSPSWEGTYVETQGYLGRVDGESNPDEVRYYVVRRDSLFAGYQVWRAPAEDTTAVSLLRTYSLFDSTWTFTAAGPRIFVDPDSIIVRGTERDRERERGAKMPGPFNGFGYVYSVTWFDGVVDGTVFPVRFIRFDSLPDSSSAYSPVVVPSAAARVSTPLLAAVRVVPNPYNPSAPFNQQVFPGAPRVEFVNLPAQALVKIFTASGDRVRELPKVPDPGDDSVVWDLKNNDGRDVASGVYIYYVESGSEKIWGHFVIAR
jgi:hypothetical protein